MLTLNPATMHAEAPHSKTKVLWVDLFNPTDGKKADAEGQVVSCALTAERESPAALGAAVSSDRSCSGFRSTSLCRLWMAVQDRADISVFTYQDSFADLGAARKLGRSAVELALT